MKKLIASVVVAAATFGVAAPAAASNAPVDPPTYRVPDDGGAEKTDPLTGVTTILVFVPKANGDTQLERIRIDPVTGERIDGVAGNDGSPLPSDFDKPVGIDVSELFHPLA